MVLMKSLFKTHSVDDIAISLQSSNGKIKKLLKLHDVPYIKVGHQWRVRQESYELFIDKLKE